MPIFHLTERIAFPPPHLAEKPGVLAIGGDLSVERLLLAYRSGIFPWYGDDEPILWWSPDPRFVLYPQELRVSASLRKCLRQERFSVTMDTAFPAVIEACATARPSTWIVREMRTAYIRLHETGVAHSVEAWHEGELAGGLYGVSLGNCFFGESMFTRVTNASKVAFSALVGQVSRWGFHFIDCQVETGHLASLGAKHVRRKRFLEELGEALDAPSRVGSWRMEPYREVLAPYINGK